MAKIEDYDWHSMTINVPGVMEDMVKERAKTLGMDKSTYLRVLIAEDIKRNSQNEKHLHQVKDLEDEKRWLVPKKKRSVYERRRRDQSLQQG